LEELSALGQFGDHHFQWTGKGKTPFAPGRLSSSPEGGGKVGLGGGTKYKPPELKTGLVMREYKTCIKETPPCSKNQASSKGRGQEEKKATGVEKGGHDREKRGARPWLGKPLSKQ